MIFFQYLFLISIGLCAGGVIAAGVFAFIVTVGAVIRLIGKTHTANHIRLVEDFIILGGTAGNIINLYDISIPGGFLFLLLTGLSSGIFVGCLVMSLAETLNTLPIFSRRIRLSTGLPWLILSIAAGKGIGSVIYFLMEQIP